MEQTWYHIAFDQGPDSYSVVRKYVVVQSDRLSERIAQLQQKGCIIVSVIIER